MTRMRETIQRAFSSFLAVPTTVIALFVLLAIGSYALEDSGSGWLQPVRDYMHDHVFGDPEATSALLGTIAGGTITITSITFSLLLLALQQSAGSMTHAVFDQFLRRRLNQAYFGFFVGMTLFTLVTLATVDPPFNPVLGASISLVLTIVALYVLLLLIYSTIDQMRPPEIIKTIHDHTLRARSRQLDLLGRTRRAVLHPGLEAIEAQAPGDGFVVHINVSLLERAIENTSATVEIEFLVAIGTYVAFHDPIATIHTEDGGDADPIRESVIHATVLGRQRNLDMDPAYGIEQLETIAWRSISTSQQNPSPGIVTIQNLRDLLARWAVNSDEQADPGPLPIVYRDNVIARLLGAFESLTVVASEAMQHQTYAEILQAFATLLDRLPAPWHREATGVLLRSLSGLGDQILTSQLDSALGDLIDAFERTGRPDAAEAFRAARIDLGMSVGRLNSRATRVPSSD